MLASLTVKVRQNKNTLLSQSAYAWLGIWFFNQTFWDDYGEFNATPIQQLLDEKIMPE